LRKRILFLLALCGLGITAASGQTFNRFNFNVGGGFGGAFGDVGKLTGTSYNGVVGGGMNFSRAFGVKAEYMYYDLGFKDSVKANQGLPDATGRLQSATLNLVYSHTLQGKLGVYAIGGGGWYQRTVEARSQFLPQGTVCQPGYKLWGITCTTGINPLVDPAQTLSSNTVSAGGYNFGGGFTYRVNWKAKVYVEGRYHHSYTSDDHTNVFPVTVGLRW
jgi:hypothetical protein